MDKQTLIKIAFIVCLLAIFGLIFSLVTYFDERATEQMRGTCIVKYGGLYAGHDKEFFYCTITNSTEFRQVRYSLSYKGFS